MTTSLSTPSTSSTTPARLPSLLLGNLALGVAIWSSGIFARIPRIVPVIIVSLVTCWTLLWRRSSSIRHEALRLDLRAVLGFHALRAPIGVAFLVLHAQGLLAGEFAVRAGVGDIIAGLGALALVPFVKSPRNSTRKVLLVWNVFGLIDILLVAATAGRMLFLGREKDLWALLHFPGPLLPTFVVPLVIVTHVLIFARVRTQPTEDAVTA